MGDDVLTTWGVVVEVESDDWVDAARVFAAAREAYLARCHRLAAYFAEAGAELRVAGERVDDVATRSRRAWRRSVPSSPARR